MLSVDKGGSGKANRTKYKRIYKWNERNQLVSSVDDNYSTAYIYGQDGQRSNKYTQNSETLYFNKMWTLHTDSGNNIYGGQTAKNIYLGDTRIVTKLNSGDEPTYNEEYYKQYYYHSDHLGSASLITDYKGDEYQRIEYTPYGETWVEKTSNTGLEYLPYRFTGKEIDEETGLYYYGARYLDPRYSRWISTDPALGEYIPGAGKATASEAGSLPGIGGIFNTVNLQLYHYAGNNPIKYTDPDGRIQFQVQAKYTMQDTNWGSRQLTGTTEESNTLAKAGCAVTLAANLFNTLGFSDYNPAKVNKEFVTSGAINWESVGKKLGMQVEAVKNTQLTKSILNKQNQDKNTGYLTFVNVNYESGNHDHWVGVTGITQKDGKDYLIISQTSENDNAVGKDNLRGKQGWLKDANGNILVPVSETKGYLNFKASIVYE